MGDGPKRVGLEAGRGPAKGAIIQSDRIWARFLVIERNIVEDTVI